MKRMFTFAVSLTTKEEKHENRISKTPSIWDDTI